jgi:hypothetical protein
LSGHEEPPVVSPTGFDLIEASQFSAFAFWFAGYLWPIMRNVCRVLIWELICLLWSHFKIFYAVYWYSSWPSWLRLYFGSHYCADDEIAHTIITIAIRGLEQCWFIRLSASWSWVHDECAISKCRLELG